MEVDNDFGDEPDEIAGIGHNSEPAKGGIAGAQLRSYVERIERVEEEKKDLAEDLRGIYAEAKGNGFDTKILRSVIKIRKQDRREREEQLALTEMYLHALGMI